MEGLKLGPTPARTIDDINEEIIASLNQLVALYKKDEKRYLRIIELQDKVINGYKAQAIRHQVLLNFLRFIP